MKEVRVSYEQLEDYLYQELPTWIRLAFDAGYRAGAQIDNNSIPLNLVTSRIKFMRDTRSQWENECNVSKDDLNFLFSNNACDIDEERLGILDRELL